MTTETVGEKYRRGFNCSTYMENYIQPGYVKIENFFNTHLFQVFKQGKMQGPRFVDIGAGPIIHRLAIASLFCDEVVHSDFTGENREAARLWMTNGMLEDKHRHFTRFIAGLEGHKDENSGAKEIEARLRTKWSLILPIDILDSNPVGDLSRIGGPFDSALSSGCFEAVCLSYRESVRAAKNVGTLLKPGAAFALLGFLNGTFYKVADATFPCFDWDAEMVQRVLQDAGYKVDFIDVIQAPPEQHSKNPDDVVSNGNAAFFCLCYKN